jgi:hypothetical protein
MPALNASLQCKNCRGGSSFHEPLKPPVSLVPSLLGTYAVPTNAEVADIHSTLLETKSKLLTLDHDIKLLEAVLKSRRRERRTLKKFHDAHDSLLSPVRRLPPELLSEIFMLLPTPSEVLGPTDWDATFILGAVCSHWRKLALSTPRLWCTIYVNLDRGNPESKADMVRTWLERSGQCPLSFGLEGEHDDCIIHPIIDVVIQHSHRLQFFDVWLPCTVMTVFAPLRGQLPMLQSLTFNDPTYGGPDSSPYDIFADAPHLRTIHIGVAYYPSSFDLPFAQISECCTSDLSTHECLEVLRKTLNARVHVFEHMYGAIVSNHAPVVSHLHSLSIAQGPHEELDPGQIFDFLTLLSIRELALEHLQPHVWSRPKFMSFVSRSSCRLEKLVLICISMSNEDLICILAAMPSLCELDIRAKDLPVHSAGEDPAYKSPVDDTTLQKLTYHSSSSGQLPPAPSLHTIRFWGHHDFEDHSLLSMVESRYSRTLPKGLGRLRSVHIQLDREFASQTMAQVEGWGEQGLDITFKTSPAAFI